LSDRLARKAARSLRDSQPALNAGYQDEACAVAAHFLKVFSNSEIIVTPSGSCASMVRRFYPGLFRNHDNQQQVQAIGARTFELSEFLVRKLGLTTWDGSSTLKIAYHDSCHLRRELGVIDEPRQLLRSIKGIQFVELADADQCCGFGGLFSVKYPELSGAILQEKLKTIHNTEIDVVVTNDAGCLAQINGGLLRNKQTTRVLHFAEMLANSLGDSP